MYALPSTFTRPVQPRLFGSAREKIDLRYLDLKDEMSHVSVPETGPCTIKGNAGPALVEPSREVRRAHGEGDRRWVEGCGGPRNPRLTSYVDLAPRG